MKSKSPRKRYSIDDDWFSKPKSPIKGYSAKKDWYPKPRLPSKRSKGSKGKKTKKKITLKGGKGKKKNKSRNYGYSADNWYSKLTEPTMKEEEDKFNRNQTSSKGYVYMDQELSLSMKGKSNN